MAKTPVIKRLVITNHQIGNALTVADVAVVARGGDGVGGARVERAHARLHLLVRERRAHAVQRHSATRAAEMPESVYTTHE